MLRTKISEVDVAVGTGKKPPQAFCACRKWPWPKGLAWHSSMSKSMRRARTASVQAGQLRLPTGSLFGKDEAGTSAAPRSLELRAISICTGGRVWCRSPWAPGDGSLGKIGERPADPERFASAQASLCSRGI